MYANGQGVTQNKIIAYALMNISASKENSGNNVALANRVKLAASMSEAEIESAQLLTRAMISKGVTAEISEYLSTHHKNKK